MSRKVAAVPGSAFGAEGYLRLSYATSDEIIQKGVTRLAAFCAGLEEVAAESGRLPVVLATVSGTCRKKWGRLSKIRPFRSIFLSNNQRNGDTTFALTRNPSDELHYD